MPTDCPCGSGRDYVDCCGPLHDGSAAAPTAERCMRSRYSAYVLRDADYLMNSWHPDTRPNSVDVDADVEWRRLTVKGTTQGTEQDDAGTVDFVAFYWDARNREHRRLAENSRFVRTAGRWLYVGPITSE